LTLPHLVMPKFSPYAIVSHRRAYKGMRTLGEKENKSCGTLYLSIPKAIMQYAES